jgi:hypothetical protein
MLRNVNGSSSSMTLTGGSDNNSYTVSFILITDLDSVCDWIILAGIRWQAPSKLPLISM